MAGWGDEPGSGDSADVGECECDGVEGISPPTARLAAEISSGGGEENWWDMLSCPMNDAVREWRVIKPKGFCCASREEEEPVKGVCERSDGKSDAR